MSVISFKPKGNALRWLFTMSRNVYMNSLALIAGGNVTNLRYADDTTLMAESEEELKSLWMKVKRRVKKLA